MTERLEVTALTRCTCVPAVEGEGYLVSIECPIHGWNALDTVRQESQPFHGVLVEREDFDA